MGSEFANVFCPLCGEKVAYFDVEDGRFENKEYFLTHLREAHRFTSSSASALVDNLEDSLGGGICGI